MADEQHYAAVEGVLAAKEMKLCGEFNWYAILSAKPGDKTRSLRIRYRDLILQVHPDKSRHPLAQVAFTFVTEAWLALKNEFTRQAYDRKISLTKVEETRSHGQNFGIRATKVNLSTTSGVKISNAKENSSLGPEKVEFAKGKSAMARNNSADRILYGKLVVGPSPGRRGSGEKVEPKAPLRNINLAGLNCKSQSKVVDEVPVADRKAPLKEFKRVHRGFGTFPGSSSVFHSGDADRFVRVLVVGNQAMLALLLCFVNTLFQFNQKSFCCRDQIPNVQTCDRLIVRFCDSEAS